MKLKNIIENIILCALFCAVLGGFYALSLSIRAPFATSAAFAAKKLDLTEATRSIHKVLFSPRDDVKQLLIGLIDSERLRIDIASFRFTDIDLATALIRAAKRGVKIFMVSDRSCPDYHYSKIPQLAQQKAIAVRLFPPRRDMQRDRVALMHNKFMIFHRNLQGRSIVATGSYNYTKSASNLNQENVVVFDDTSAVDAYKNQFVSLFDRSEQFKKEHKANGIFDCILKPVVA